MNDDIPVIGPDRPRDRRRRRGPVIAAVVVLAFAVIGFVGSIVLITLWATSAL